jgi:aspartokinase-like uncharacterized kinase
MGAGLIVVKIGGSLASDRSRLAAILARLADAGAGRVAVVPGGGNLADAVRVAQAGLGFDDVLAHRLALGTMGAMARIFAAIEPRLTVAETIPALEAACRRGTVPVWDPVLLRSGHPDIPETWAVTSDSLAVWLATQLGAAKCVLVKSIDAPTRSSWDAWAASGLVDSALPDFARSFRGDVVVHGPGGADLAAILDPPLRAVS